MSVIAAEISAGMFHFDKESNTFSQEISSLGGFDPMSQIYDDACDQGFKMVSVKNPKNYALFYFDGYDYHDGELVGCRFNVVEDRNTVAMGMSGTKVLIIND